jgi:hypothetical protein
MPSSTSRI